jgi:hypothetical protein
VTGRLAETIHATGPRVVVGNSLMPGIYFAKLEIPGRPMPVLRLIKNK